MVGLITGRSGFQARGWPLRGAQICSLQTLAPQENQNVDTLKEERRGSKQERLVFSRI